MRRNGQTSGRPEEKLTAVIITAHLSCVRHFFEQQKVWLNQKDYCKPDIIFVTDKQKKFIVRVNGPWHDERENEDRLQKFRLEELHYTVIDFNHTKMPMLFLRNKRLLTLDELHEAYVEVKMELKKYKLDLMSFNPDLLYDHRSS